MRASFITLLLISITSLLTSCNTVEGVGQDLQAGGRKIEKAADDNK